MKRKLLSLPRASRETNIGYKSLLVAVADGSLPRAKDSDGDELLFLGTGLSDPVFVDERDVKAFAKTYTDGRRLPVGRE